MRKAGVREEGQESPPSLRRPMKWGGKSRRKNTCLETGPLQSARWEPTLRARKAQRVLMDSHPEGTAMDVGLKTWKKFWARLHQTWWRAP